MEGREQGGQLEGEVTSCVAFRPLCLRRLLRDKNQIVLELRHRCKGILREIDEIPFEATKNKIKIIPQMRYTTEARFPYTTDVYTTDASYHRCNFSIPVLHILQMQLFSYHRCSIPQMHFF